MFKSLLRTLPSLSGNVKLVCDVSDIRNDNKSNEYIDCYVNNASLEPISKNVYKQPININLFKSRYDYDLTQFYALYSDIFYKSCYNYSKVDAKKIDKSHEANERDKDFEFGCSRVSYQDNNKQFSFFAPIYIDNVFDIPDAFIIEANIRYGKYNIKKKLKINIASGVDLTDSKTNIIYKSKNLLFNYIYNYVFNIDDKVIYMDYVDPNMHRMNKSQSEININNNVYYYGIDLKRGGFTRTQDITVNKIFSEQQTINNFDNIICSGFKNTNICMKQILPLCFNFNISDIFTEYDASKLYLSDIIFSGYYINKNNKIEELFDFDIDYSNFDLNILDINSRTGEIMTVPGLIDNMMDYSFPSLHEKYFYKYQFMNKISPNTTRWILAASNITENYNYIINHNVVFSLNQDSQYKYRYFPVEVNSGNNIACCNKISFDTDNKVNDYNYDYNKNNIYLTKNNKTILYNLLLPIESKISNNISNFQSEVYNSVNDMFSSIYKRDKISNCYDFFNIIYHDNRIYNILNKNTDIITKEKDYNKYIDPSGDEQYQLLQSTSDDNISIFDKTGFNYNKLWKTPVNDYVYYNDILYNLNNLYINNSVKTLEDRYNKFLNGDIEVTKSLFDIAKQNKKSHFIDNTSFNNYLELQKITKFGIFAIPFFNIINNKQIKKLYNVNNLFTLVNNASNIKSDDIIVSSNILDKEYVNNKKLNFYNAKDTIDSINLNTIIDVNNDLYIDDKDSYNKWNNIFSVTNGYLTSNTYNYIKEDQGETKIISYNIYNMSDDWVNKYSLQSDYAYMYCDYDNLMSYIQSDMNNYTRSNIYVDLEQIKEYINIEYKEYNIIEAYELLPIYDVKLISSYEIISDKSNNIVNINTLNDNDSSHNYKDYINNTYLYYVLQNNSIINLSNTVLSNINNIDTTNDNKSFLEVKNVSSDNKLLLMGNDIYSINNYGLYDYTLYNKKKFVEIDSIYKYELIKNLETENKHIDIFSFVPYIKHNGNIIIKNIMMKRQLETEFDGNLIRNENDINYLWTDIYNLLNLFDKYNTEQTIEENKINYDNNKTRYFYFDFINKEHLKNYLEYVSGDERGRHYEFNEPNKEISQIDWKFRNAADSIDGYNTPFTELYVCEKVFVINTETKLSSVKYRYEKFTHLIQRSFKEQKIDESNINSYKYLKNYTLYDLCRNITFVENTSFVDINISFNDEQSKIVHNWTIQNVHLVYRKKFYPVNEDIMVNLANLFDANDVPINNNNELWCDFYFAKPCSNLDYDIMSEGMKYPIINDIDAENSIYSNDYIIVDNDMSNLTPLYNDVHFEERENTKISTLININDITVCKQIIGNNIEKRYRYAKNKYNNFIRLNTLCLNNILDIYNRNVIKEVESGNENPTTLNKWIEKTLSHVNVFTKYNTMTNFVKLITNNIPEYNYLNLAKYNIFTYYKDGEIYGFYLYGINVNNTSEMFDNIYGFDILLKRSNNTNIKMSSSNVSKFDSFNNHPFFCWKIVNTSNDDNSKNDNVIYDYLYDVNGMKYFVNNIQKIMPITNISIMKHLYEISNVISKPNVTNLNINYVTKTLNTSNKSKENNIIYTKRSNNDIISLKKLKMTRYFGYILPRMKSVDKLIHDNKFNYVFNLKCKWIDNTILEEGIYNSINDTPLDFWIDSNVDKSKDNKESSQKYDNFNIKVRDYSTIHNIYKYAPITIFDISNDTTIKDYNNFIENYTEPEYKHFNCSKLYNLIPKIIINDNNKYTYQEILNMSTDTTCINKFIKYINNYNNSRYKRSHTKEYDDNLTYSELLFLYNRYKCTIKTNCVGVNNDDLKLFTIRYIYTLL